MVFDMHCHIDFAAQAYTDRGLASFLLEASGAGIGGFWNTVEPKGYLDALEALKNGATSGNAGAGAFALGVGLHPWWLADGTCGQEDVGNIVGLICQTRFVGEIGLDFAPRRDGTQDMQVEAFDRIVGACVGDGGGRVLSIHAVRSGTAVLDVLERHGAARSCACILHWFSGSGEELARAVRLGCHFSVGERMFATRRGRAYARAIPRERLLLETDLPNGRGDTLDPQAWLASLHRAEDLLAAEVLGVAPNGHRRAYSVWEREELVAQVAANSARLLAG